MYLNKHRALDKREYLDDNFSYILIETICCGPSFELSRRDGSDEGHNICFNAELTKLSLLITKTPSFLEL